MTLIDNIFLSIAAWRADMSEDYSWEKDRPICSSCGEPIWNEDETNGPFYFVVDCEVLCERCFEAFKNDCMRFL